MFGRRQIFTDEAEITLDNVASVIENAYATHMINRGEINYLLNYYKGKQPIIDRIKAVRPEICNKIVENRANAIVSFRVGYTVGKPIQYISSVDGEDVSKAIAKLNDMMRVQGKATKDKQLVEWMMICGTGYRMVLPNQKKGAKVPYNIYTLDPRNTFVIYRNDFTQEPIAGVYCTTDKNANTVFSVYTKDSFYEIRGGKATRSDFYLNEIPIVEYPLNMSRLGSFEVVLPLLDTLNNIDSNAMDSIEQFVQSLMVVYNAQFEDGTTANTIRDAGMVILKSVGDNKADIKIISEVLNQSDTQNFKSNVIQSVNEIVGMPSQGNGSTGDSSNNGAVVLKNGWQGAETRAEDFEAMFKLPEQKMLEIVAGICDRVSDFAFNPDDVDVKFTRRNYESLLEKSQTLTTLLNAPYVHPQCAYEASGLFVDTQEAFNMGLSWHEENARDVENAEEVDADGEKPTSV